MFSNVTYSNFHDIVSHLVSCHLMSRPAHVVSSHVQPSPVGTVTTTVTALTHDDLRVLFPLIALCRSLKPWLVVESVMGTTRSESCWLGGPRGNHPSRR